MTRGNGTQVPSRRGTHTHDNHAGHAHTHALFPYLPTHHLPCVCVRACERSSSKLEETCRKRQAIENRALFTRDPNIDSNSSVQMAINRLGP